MIMPLKSCPVDEKTLAEYALGPERSRLAPDERLHVERHLPECETCRRDLADYRACAAVPVPDAGRDLDPALVASTQNLMTRFHAQMLDRANDHARRELSSRWRGRTALGAALCLLAAGACFHLFGAVRPPVRPSSPPVTRPMESTPTGLVPDLPAAPANAALATALSEPDRQARERAKADMEKVAEQVRGLELGAALALLDEARESAQRETPEYAATALTELAALQEDFWKKARDGAFEGPALLSLSRTCLAAGDRPAWMAALSRYAAWRGRQAYGTAIDGNDQADAPALARKAERRAEASVYFDEALYQYRAKDAAAALQLCDRLFAQYADTAKAYEGQAIAARCYIANKQPSGAVAAYLRIVDHCPDEPFARASAKTYLQMLSSLNRLDEAAAESRRLAERFPDDDFRGFALLVAGEALIAKGERHYPEAVRNLREAQGIKSDSDYAVRAAKLLQSLQRKGSDGPRGIPLTLH